MTIKGINFRATSGYVTDGTDETYDLGAAYPVTRGGLTFGWSSGNTSNSRDRFSSIDRRLAGIVSGSGGITYRLDLPNGPGIYNVRIAIGDAAFDITTHNAVIKDGSTSLVTISGATLLDQFRDITNTVRSRAQWVSEYATTLDDLTFANSYLTIEFPAGGTQLAHLSVEFVSSGATPIAFAGTIPTQTFTEGDSVDVDLSSYFSGTETPFSYSSVGASFAALGLTINSSTGHLTGTAVEGSVGGCQIRGTDATPDTDDSNTFTITVNDAPENPVITSQPSADTVKNGQTAEFAITATGSGTVTYQWQEDDGGGFSNISDGGSYSGATTDTLSIVTTRAMDGYEYRCNVSDDDAGPVTSDEVALTVQQCVLALTGAGYNFGDGNDVDTIAVENAVAWEVAVVADELPVTATLYHSASSTTSSTGYLSDIGDDDFVFGTTYVVQARRVSDGEWITFPITAS